MILLSQPKYPIRNQITMKDSTETLVTFAQLLEAEPPILQPDALTQVQKLAAELNNLSEADMDRAADTIITWMEQFPQAKKAIQKARARNRKEVKKIPEPDPNQSYSLIPNVEIIEETETTVIITPAPNAEKISLFLYVKQALSRWTQKKP